MFCVHIDIFKKFKYITLRYLIKALFIISVFKTCYINTYIYNRLHEDEPSVIFMVITVHQ